MGNLKLCCCAEISGLGYEQHPFGLTGMYWWPFWKGVKYTLDQNIKLIFWPMENYCRPLKPFKVSYLCFSNLPLNRDYQRLLFAFRGNVKILLFILLFFLCGETNSASTHLRRVGRKSYQQLLKSLVNGCSTFLVLLNILISHYSGTGRPRVRWTISFEIETRSTKSGKLYYKKKLMFKNVLLNE